MVNEKFESAVTNLINEKPYLIGISQLITKLPASNVPTLCVTFYASSYFMFYNEEFVANLEFEELKTILLHEFMHIMLNHMQRYKKFYDAGISPDVLNIACDAAINQYLKNMPSWAIYPGTFGGPEGYTFEQYTDFIINKFFNNVKKLTKKKKGSPVGQSGTTGGQGEGDEEGDSSTGGQGDQEPEDGEGQGDSDEGGLTKDTQDQLLDDLFDKDNCGSHELWKDITEDEAETAKELMKAAVQQAANKMAGNMPGNLIQQIAVAWEEPINWKGAIKYFYDSVRASFREYSRSIRDRRRGLAVPGAKKGESCRLLIATDNSGSMSDADLNHVLSECRFLGKNLKIEADVLQFDYDIQNLSSINRFVAEKKFMGRGGTNFQVVFDFMQDRNFRLKILRELGHPAKFKRYDGFVIYTDGCAPAPVIKKHMKILWLLTPGSKKPEGSPGREQEVKIPNHN